MNPYIFRYKSISVSWFMALALISILLAYVLVKNTKHKLDINNDKLENTYFLLVVIGFIGARLSYVLFNFESYKDNLSYVFKLTHFNLNLAGGVFFALIGLLVIARLQKISFFTLLEVLVAPFYLSMSIGVWVMYFDGMLVGKPYQGIFALNYLGNNRHIVALYLSVLFIFGVIFQLSIIKRFKNKYKSIILLVFVLGLYYFLKIGLTY